MAKEFTSIKDFTGKSVFITYIQAGSEEITGTVTAVKDGFVTLVQTSRGSTYTYRIPSTELLYTKAEDESELKKGVEITVERQINRRKKVTGTVIAIDGMSIVVDQGEKRGRMVTSVFALANLEEVSYAEQTAEGKKASKAKSDRMRAAKADKPSKSGKKLKLKVVDGKKKRKAA